MKACDRILPLALMATQSPDALKVLEDAIIEADWGLEEHRRVAAILGHKVSPFLQDASPPSFERWWHRLWTDEPFVAAQSVVAAILGLESEAKLMRIGAKP